MRTIVASAIGVAVWMLLGSHALAQDWVVGKVSGKAWMSANGAAPTLLAPGMAVPQGSTISTGPDGRALLVHGQDMVTVGPKSALSVQAGAGAQRTTVLQKSGRITVDVETQERAALHGRDAVHGGGRQRHAVRRPGLAARR